MKIYIKDGHTVIEAEDGNIVQRKDGAVKGKAISLGSYSRVENYEEVENDNLVDEEETE